eukprot:COSAG05_NODE_2235_length_3357_cov_13.339779_2_plen_156_part_00
MDAGDQNDLFITAEVVTGGEDGTAVTSQQERTDTHENAGRGGSFNQWLKFELPLFHPIPTMPDHVRAQPHPVQSMHAIPPFCAPLCARCCLVVAVWLCVVSTLCLLPRWLTASLVLNSLRCSGKVVVLSCMIHVRTWAKTRAKLRVMALKKLVVY